MEWLSASFAGLALVMLASALLLATRRGRPGSAWGNSATGLALMGVGFAVLPLSAALTAGEVEVAVGVMAACVAVGVGLERRARRQHGAGQQTLATDPAARRR